MKYNIVNRGGGGFFFWICKGPIYFVHDCREGAETTKVVQMVAEVRWVCETLEIEKVDQKSAQ